VSEHLGYNPAHSHVGVGMEGVGLGSVSEWGMKVIGYEQAEFSETCKWTRNI